MAKTTNFLPVRTVESELSNVPIVNGQFILITDTKKLFTDYNDGSADKRIQITSTIDEFSSEKDYAVSDLTIYNNILYRCINAYKGNFDATKWQAISDDKEVTIYQDKTPYQSNDLVIYNNNLYMRKTAGTDTIWNEVNWQLIGGSGEGDGIQIYDASQTYKINDLIIYEDQLYRCIFAEDVTGAFDETKWTLISGNSVEIYDSNKEYKTNDLVIYDNSIFQCISTDSITGAFDETKWQLIGAKIISTFEPDKVYAQYDIVLHEDNGTMSIWMRNTEGSDSSWNSTNWTKVSGGADGSTPYIDSSSKHWIIGATDTGIIAEGQNGQDGKDGKDSYVYIKYSATEPTQDSDMKDTIDAYIGIANGDTETAPTSYTAYKWFKIKGDPGDAGVSSYTFIKYSSIEPASNSDMKDTPDAWMGIAIVSNNEAPIDYTQYVWYKIKGNVEISADCVILYATLLASNWIENNNTFIQQVNVDSILTSNIPVIDINLSDNSALWVDEKNSYGCVDKIETFDGYIIATCGSKKPTSDFSIKMKIAGDLTEQNTVTKDEYNTLLNKISTTYTGTFTPENWSSIAPFQQTVLINNLPQDINPIIDLVVNEDIATGIEENKQWCYLTKAQTAEGSITGYCYEKKPAIALNFKLKGF